jgi:signal recognition particle subunit SRP54
VGEAMKDIRMALLEADVDFQVTKDLVETVTKQSVGAEVLRTVSPGQQIVKIFHDELVKTARQRCQRARISTRRSAFS